MSRRQPSTASRCFTVDGRQYVTDAESYCAALGAFIVRDAAGRIVTIPADR